MLAVCISGTMSVSHAQQGTEKDRLVIKSFFDYTLSEQQSYRWLEDLCAIGPRLSGSEQSMQAIHWVKSVMDTCGFDRVYLQEVMVPHWERGAKESALIIDSKGNEYPLEVLAIGGSVATPPEGFSAEIVEVGSLVDLEEFDDAVVEGKIVFFNPHFDQRNILTGASYGANVSVRARGAIKAAEKGAVASVIRSISSAHDDVPHTGTGNYTSEVDSIPAAALGVKSADLLHSILKLDPKARLFLQMNSKWYAEALSYNVVGEIKGTEFPDEIIVIGGHLDSWDVGEGAHDDGAGCMHALGALKLLTDLDQKPRRTIRAVMFINEENGTRGGEAYANLAVNNEERHIVAIESDAGGYSPRGFGVTASDLQRERLNRYLELFPRNTISYFSKGGGGVDIGPLHRATGTPMMGLVVDGQKMFDLHHSANDVFAAVHPRELELGTASMASLVYLIDQYGF